MENAELIKAARAEANCKQFYKQYNDCYGCPMPHKDNPSYQRMCVDFDEEVLPQLADALEEADKRIAELEAAQRWIPVSEKMPRYNQEVLTFSPGLAIPVWVDAYDGYYGEDDDEWHEGWRYRGINVTHWQPLPKPPQKGMD